MLTLAAGGWEAELAPAIGGSIAALRHDGQDVLRPAPAGAVDPLTMASFPLVPYANRIAKGRFAFGGSDVALPRNFGDHPHSLHGVGWQRPWSVIDATTRDVTLALDHPGDADWPWAFTARQRFHIDEAGFVITLKMTAGAESMPAGLGLHPYIAVAADARLQMSIAAAWLADETQLPTHRVAPNHFGNWATGDVVTKNLLVDHCHEGWSGEARLIDVAKTVSLRARGAEHLHLYIPPSSGFVCIEPVSHLPDAVNHADRPSQILAAHESISLELLIAVHRLQMRKA